MGKFKLTGGDQGEPIKPLPQESKILEVIANEILLEKFPKCDQIEASLATLPSKNTDADFNAFIVHDERHIDIVFGDVSLKGVEATILSTRIKELIPKENVYSSGKKLPSLEEIVGSIEEHAFDLLRTHGAYLTLFYGRFDLEKMQFSFIDRGFTRTLIVDKEGETYFLTSNYLPIGIERGSESGEESVPIHADEKWIFYSDGLITIRNRSREHFGFSRFSRLIEEVKNQPIQEMQKVILSQIDQFRENLEITGEIILMILRILPKSKKKKKFHEALQKERKEIQEIVHDLITRLTPLSEELEIKVDEKRIVITYYGPVLDLAEMDLRKLRENVDDVRYGKDIKGKSYIEISRGS